MVASTTYPVFLADPKRHSAVAVSSAAKGQVAWSKELGLPPDSPDRTLLVWEGRIVVNTGDTLTVFSHKGDKLWKRQQQQGGFTVAGNGLLYYYNLDQRLDAAKPDNTLAIKSAYMPSAYKTGRALPLFWPYAKDCIYVVYKPPMGHRGHRMFVYRQQYNQDEATWGHMFKSSYRLPPLLIPEKERVVMATQEVLVLDASTGAITRFPHPLKPAHDWSAGSDGTLYLLGRTPAKQQGRPDQSVLLALDLAGKELWRWSGSSARLAWAKQPPVVGQGGAIHAFAGTAILTIKGGTLAWDYKVAATFGTALADGTLLVSAGSNLLRLSKDGDRLFSVDVKATILTPPVVDGAGSIYVATAKHLVKVQ